MSRRHARLSLLVVALAGAPGFAFNRGPKEFSPPTSETTYTSKSHKMGTFAEAEGNGPEEAPPWAFIGLMALCFAVAAPIGYKVYKSMSAETEELVDRQKSPAPRARRTKPKADPEATE